MSCLRIIILLVLGICCNGLAEPLNEALNGIQVYMEAGQPIFDQKFYEELTQCMNQIDSRLFQMAGAQWDGMLKYANAGGSIENNDIWHTCDEQLKWFEKNCTVQEYGSMPIFEPCNYASNLAYYHTATEICNKKQWALPQEQVDAMGMTFVILAQGSAFWHGSETSNGAAADVVINDLFAYVAFQAALEILEPSDDSLIHELSLTPRAKSAAEVTNEFVDMYIEVPVEEWEKLLEAADIPSLRLTMCGYFGTVLTLLYDQEVVDELVDYLIGAFELPDDVKIFCLQQFLPTMRNATEHIELPSDEFFKLEGNLLSTGLKLIYAFLWQEQFLVNDPIWLQPSTNEVGAAFLPVINQAMNGYNSWNYSDTEMQLGINMYPGEAWCNPLIPHAKWHLQTGIALTDFTFLSDELYRIFSTYY